MIPPFPRRAALALPALLLTPALGRPASAQADTLAKARAAGVLVVGNGGAFPPFEFVENGRLTGFDVDMGEEIGRRLGLRIEWRVTDFAGLIPALVSGRVDCLMTAFTHTEERAARIAFSTPYYRTGIAAAFRPSVSVTRPADLAGRIVGVQTGSAGERFVRDGYANVVREIRNYPEFPLALRDLEIGRTEVVVNTLPTLRYNLTRRAAAGLRVTEAWEGRDVGINTRLGDAALLAEFNRLVAEMRGDGFLAGLDARWFGA